VKILLSLSFRKSSQIVALSVIALGIGICGQAQENLVNFYNWTVETSPPGNILPFLDSYNSAAFVGDYNITQPGPAFFQGIITGNIETTPSVTYQISFTMQNGGDYYLGDPTMSFGNYGMSCDLLAGETLAGGDYVFVPENYEFTVVATGPITTMTFDVVADNGQVVSLSNVSVTAVPEPSSGLVFSFSAFTLVLAHRRKRSNL